VGASADYTAVQFQLVELAGGMIGTLGNGAVGVCVLSDLPACSVTRCDGVRLRRDRKRFRGLSTTWIVGQGDRVGIASAHCRCLAAGPIVGECVAIGDGARGTIGCRTVIPLSESTGTVANVRAGIAYLILFPQQSRRMIVDERHDAVARSP